MKARVMISVTVLALLILIPSSLALSQTAASVTWNLVPTDSLNVSAVVGNVTGVAAVGTDSFVVRSYSGQVGGVNGLLGGYCRWNPGSGVNWGPETVQVANHYVQFVAAPATGNAFTIDSVSFWSAGGGTGNMRAFAYYSKDAGFSSPVRLTPASGASGDTIVLLNSGTAGNDRRYAFKVGTTVNSGQSFYLRFYPWYNGSASTSKYFYTQQTIIKGTTVATTAVEQSDAKLPEEYALGQNYPNPFNPSTVISYELPRSGAVKLIVYDILGNEISQLVNEVQSAGVHSVVFRAKNLSSGMYFYKLQAGSFLQTRKMVLLK